MCHAAEAVTFCVNDDANLCSSCDVKFHSNPLAARHERRPLSCIPGIDHSSSSSQQQPQYSIDGVVPQCAPQTFTDDDFFLLPDASFAMNPELEALADDFLNGGSLGPLPSGDDLLDFDFDGVVPSMSGGTEQRDVNVATTTTSPLHHQFPEVPVAALFPSTIAAVPVVQPFIYHDDAQMARMMIPTTTTVATTATAVAPMIVEKATPGAAAAAANDRKRSRATARSVAYLDDDEDFEVESEDDDDEDDSDGEFVIAPRRSHASRARRGDLSISYSLVPELELTRAERVARYREKRARRSFKKTIRYQSRKAYAEIRPRIKGRFVSPEEYAAYTNEHQIHQAEAVVPVC